MSAWTLLDVFCLLGSILTALVVWYFPSTRKRAQEPHKRPLEKDKDKRPFGEWIPQDFEYPPFQPVSGFDIHTTSAIRYRPFRWGPKYNVTMGIRPMSWESWIELDNTFLETYAIKKRRALERGSKLVRTLPGAEKAALEVCTELASYLAKRYPQVFTVTRVHDGEGLGGDSIVGKSGGRVKFIEIIPVGDVWDLDKDDPMLVANLISEDLAIMMEGVDGQYYLQAGAICVPGFWRLEDKIGLPLKDIHLSGGVYQYKEKLELSLDRFFRKLPVDKPVLRNNYFFQIDPNLAWAAIHHGDEDKFDQSTHAPRSEYLLDGHWQPPKAATEMSQVFFRSERQSLRRMPKTGCICFTIRTYFFPLTEMMDEPGVPGRLAAAIRSWPEAIAKRKEKDLFAETLLPILDDQHQKQIISGIIKEDDRADNYPY